MDIVKRAIEEPLRALARNAGVEGSIVVQEVKKRKGNEGYNVAPASTKTSSRPAWWTRRKSRARRCKTRPPLPDLLLTTECLVTELPEKEKAPAGGGGHGGGMGGMGGGMDY